MPILAGISAGRKQFRIWPFSVLLPSSVRDQGINTTSVDRSSVWNRAVEMLWEYPRTSCLRDGLVSSRTVR
jgi:hypothetical protein